jgi:hypothetical protein
VPEPPGAAVVDLGDDTLVMSAAAPQGARLFRDRGYHVVPLAISEFEKLEGLHDVALGADPNTATLTHPAGHDSARRARRHARTRTAAMNTTAKTGRSTFAALPTAAAAGPQRPPVHPNE